MYRHLDSARILETIEQLCQRIEERFPGAGLAKVGRELLALARACAIESEALAKPNIAVRMGVAALVLVMILGTGFVFYAAWARKGLPAFSTLGEYVQAIEAAVNDLVFLGVGVFFLFSVETRSKRRRALKALHELRSIAHVVDMHQLTKDPERISSTQPDTTSSPPRVMSQEQLGRYLDYCSEMLSLTSKVSALYIQSFDDAVVLAAVNEVENLTTSLSRKIWQKISIVEQQAARVRTGVPV
jgi:hypothetical protein